MPDPIGYAPLEYLQRQYLGQSAGSGGYQLPTGALQYLSPEQIQMLGGSTQQNPVDQFIASLPPETQSNPTAILQAASTNPSLAQAVAEKFGLDAGSMTFENPYRAPISEALGQAAKDVLIPWGAATGAIALTGAGAGGGAAALPSAGGSATTYPLASAGGAITATPIATGAGAATVAGTTTAAGAIPAAASAAGGTVPNWVNWANLGSTVLGVYGAGKAADAQVAGSQAAIDEAKRQYDTTRADFQPAIKLLGESSDALSKYNSGDTSGFFTSPEYQYNLEQTQKAGERSLAAMGLRQSGPAVKEAQRNASGLASRESGAFVNRLLAAAGLGTTGASNVATVGANTSAQVGNAQQNAGAARASGYANQYGALNGGVTNYLLQKYLRAA